MIDQSRPPAAPIGALTELDVGFTVILSEHDGEEVMVVSGDVSGSAASALASLMVALDGGDDQVVIDLSSVTSIDPAGVTVLLQEHGRLVGEGRTLILEAPSPPALEVLNRMGMNDIVTIRPAAPAGRARLVVVADG